MPRTYFGRELFRQSQVDIFDQQARQTKADLWAQEALARKDEIAASVLGQTAGVDSVDPSLPDLSQEVPQPAATPAVSLSSPTGIDLPRGAAGQQFTPSTVELTQGARAGNAGVDRNAILGQIGDVARQLGLGDDGARVAQAIAVTEGGLTGAVGDLDRGRGSFGPFQFFADKGQLPAYAAFMGTDQFTAGEYARHNPLHAAQWALQNYLGNAIKNGIAQGLSGPELATFAQRYGQVSESPERAGANYNSLFGGGSQPFAAGGQVNVPSPTLGLGERSAAGYAAAVAEESVGGAPSVGPQTGGLEPDRVQMAQQWADNALQGIGSWLSSLGGREPSETELSDFLRSEQLRQNMGARPTDDYGNLGPSTAPGSDLAPDALVRRANESVAAGVRSAIGDEGGPTSLPLGPSTAPGAGYDPLTGEGRTGLNRVRADVFPSIADPKHPSAVYTEMLEKYPGRVPGEVDVSRMTPEERQRWQEAQVFVGGMTLSGSGGTNIGRVNKRMYHGTGSEFDVPDPSTFSPNGLYGPGYYVTSDARVAGGIVDTAPGSTMPRTTGGYAEGRMPTFYHDMTEAAESADYYRNLAAGRDPHYPNPTPEQIDKWEFSARESDRRAEGLSRNLPPSGPNVRAVDVPEDLRLFDVEAPAGTTLLDDLSEIMDPRDFDSLRNGMRYNRGPAKNWTNDDVYQELRNVEGGWSEGTNRYLQSLGYDGIRYSGGQRIPMRDAGGANIEHDAYVIFPEALGKIRNAISGRQGGQASAPFATTLGGAAGGGATGYATTPEDASPGERIARTIGGAVAGAGLGAGVSRLPRRMSAMADADFASGGLGRLVPRKEPTDEVMSTYEALARQWDELDHEIVSALDQAAAAHNPGLKQRYMNQAERLRVQQEDVWRQTQYIEEHGEILPRETVDLAETMPRGEGAQALQDRMASLRARAAAEPRQAERTLLQNEAEEVRRQLDQIAPETVAPPSGPSVGIDDESIRRQGHIFGETQAAKRRATLPKGEMPQGAKPIDLTTAEEVKRLRLEQWPEELRDVIRQGAEARDFARTQRRGVVPDAVSEAMADDMPRTFDEWVKASKSGKAFNAEELRALRNAVGAQAAKTRQLGADVGVARQAGNLTDNQLIQQFSEGQKLQALIEMFEGGKAEWGRAGRAFQGAARLVDLPPDEATARIYKMVGGRENALKALDEYQKLLDSGADAIAQAQFWARVKNPPAGAEDWFRLIRYNSMLSGPRTMEINAIGGVTELLWKGGRDVATSLAKGDLGSLRGEVTGIVSQFKKANENFLDTLRHGITSDAAARGDLPQSVSSRTRNPVGKTAATVLEAPGRMLQAVDEWVRTIAYGMELGRQSGKTASSMGLKGDAWSEHVAKILSDPSPALMKAADEAAERLTFKGDMGSLGEALAHVQKVPYVGNILLPFLRTVYHITARGVDRSPLGAVGTAVDLARGAYAPGKALPKGVRPLGERSFDNAVGTAATAAFAWYAFEGKLSGAGPDDPEKRDLLRAQGWQPYSVKIGDRWVSYSNWGPIAVPLAMSAAIAEGQQYKKGDDNALQVFADTARRFGELTTEQTYLQGIGLLYKAIKDPEAYGSQWTTGLAQSMVPFGAAINTAGQAGDDVQRKPEKFDIPQALAGRNVPGFGGRDSVPVAQDVLGRPVQNQQSGINAINPLRSSQSKPDPAAKLFADAGVDLPRPDDRITLDVGRGQSLSVPIKPEEERYWQQRFGEHVQQLTADLQTNPKFAEAPIEVRAKELQRRMAEARRRADIETAKRMGNAEIDQRVKADRAIPKRVPLPTP